MTLTTPTALPEQLRELAPFSHDIEIVPRLWTAAEVRRVRNRPAPRGRYPRIVEVVPHRFAMSRTWAATAPA